MGHSLVIAGILFVLTLSMPMSGAATTLYVKPTQDTRCPGNPCLTLSEYAQNARHYFTSNSTFDFLPGNHSLNTDITIVNVSGISLLGERNDTQQISTWITCTEPAFFNVTLVQGFKIAALSFRSCGRGTMNLRAVYLNNVHRFAIEQSSFEQSIGSSLLISSGSGTMYNVSFIGCTSQYGGAVLAFTSSLIFSGVTSFSGNRAEYRGGAIYAEASLIEFQDSATFKDNLASALGGAIAVLNTTVHFNGRTTFESNAAFLGGAITAFHSSHISSTDNITFIGNSAGAGGALHSTLTSTIQLTGSSAFIGNTAVGEGSMIVAQDSHVLLNGTNIFNDNHITQGNGGIYANGSNLQFDGHTVFSGNSARGFAGAMFVYFTNVTMSGTALFTENSAGIYGGALSVTFGSFKCSGSVQFDRNFAPQLGGAIGVSSEGYLSFTGTTVFTNNYCTSPLGPGAISAYVSYITFNGATIFDSTQRGAVYAFFSTVSFIGHSNFTANSGNTGSAIYSVGSDISFTGEGVFLNNTCTGTGGAVYTAGGSTLRFNGSFHFYKNQASQGGAISTEHASLLGLVSPAKLRFTENKAAYGGALFVLDRLTLNYCTQVNLLQRTFCFFEVFGTHYANASSTTDVHLTFVNNTAEVAGSALYGGLLQQCFIVFANVPSGSAQTQSANAYFHEISDITSHGNTSVISSDPVNICFCQNYTYDCAHSLPPFHRSPGQSFHFSAVAVDQSTNPVPASIRATLSVGSTGELGTGERTQVIHPFCSRLQYRVFSSVSSETLTLAAQGECNELGTALRSVSVVLTSCPTGFELIGDHCLCEERLRQLSTTCDVDTSSIERVNNFWVNASYSNNGSYQGLIIHPHCPFDYCHADPVNFTLDNPNAQCAFNRSGFLCGGCDSGFSLTLGGSQCARCSNSYLALLAAFVALGFALILVVSLCRLTVGAGTINGLIFYANIVQINKTIFFPAGDSNVLTVFIAWVNLDFGIKTCFFDGLNSYARTWLQFAFPFYVWLLVALLIFVSKYSVRITQFLGSNLVEVLATVFLLSYAKLLRTIISALYATFLVYPDGSEQAVWLIDGNVKYLHGQHIPLFVFALIVLFFFFLPYTLFLLLGQWLRNMSGLKNNLSVKYFLETYYGLCKPYHQYWTGFFLLIRCTLFLIFAFNFQGAASLNLLVIACSMLAVLFLTRLTKGIYKLWTLDLLEASYFLNLGILAAGTYHIDLAGGNQAVLAYISVGIAFATFVATATVQAYKQFKITRLGRKIPDIATLFHRRAEHDVVEGVNEEEVPVHDAGDIAINAPVVTEYNIPLRESLLET